MLFTARKLAEKTNTESSKKLSEIVFKIAQKRPTKFAYCFRGVSGYLKLGGQVVMWRTAAAQLHGGAFYSAKK